MDLVPTRPLSPQTIALRSAYRYAREVSQQARAAQARNTSQESDRLYRRAGNLLLEHTERLMERSTRNLFDPRRRSPRTRECNRIHNDASQSMTSEIGSSSASRRILNHPAASSDLDLRRASSASSESTRIEIGRVEGPSAPDSVLHTDQHMQQIQRIPNLFALDEPAPTPLATSGLDALAEAAVSVYRQDVLSGEDAMWTSGPRVRNGGTSSLSDLFAAEVRPSNGSASQWQPQSAVITEEVPSLVNLPLSGGAATASDEGRSNSTSRNLRHFTNLRDLDPGSAVALQVSAALSASRSTGDGASSRSMETVNDDLESVDSTMATVGSPTPSNFSELLENTDESRLSSHTPSNNNSVVLSAPSRGSVETELETYQQTFGLPIPMSIPLSDIPESRSTIDASALPELFVRPSWLPGVPLETSPPLLSSATVTSLANVVLPQAQRPASMTESSDSIVSQTLQRSLMTLLEQPADPTPQLATSTHCSVTEVPQPVTSAPLSSTSLSSQSRRSMPSLPPPFSGRNSSLRADLAVLNASETNHNSCCDDDSRTGGQRCHICRGSRWNLDRPPQAREASAASSRRMPRPRLSLSPTGRSRLGGLSDASSLLNSAPASSTQHTSWGPPSASVEYPWRSRCGRHRRRRPLHYERNEPVANSSARTSVRDPRPRPTRVVPRCFRPRETGAVFHSHFTYFSRGRLNLNLTW